MPYLIDGHNLIAQTPGLALDDPDDERKLVELLRAYLVRTRKKGTVVFDRGLPGGPSRWSNAVLKVYFAGPPQTADSIILARLRSERNPRGLIVVSGDRAIAGAAERAGATVVPSRAFAPQMLAKPPEKHKKQTGLQPDEVAEWEAEFKKAREKQGKSNK